jgi:hypothetical protein
MSVKRLSLTLVLLAALAAAMPAQTAKHPLKLDDLFRMQDVRDPQLSPDGQWIAYVLSAVNVKDDKSSGHIWMIGFDGKNNRQITSSQDSEGPRAGAPTESIFRSPLRVPDRLAAIRYGCSIAAAETRCS